MLGTRTGALGRGLGAALVALLTVVTLTTGCAGTSEKRLATSASGTSETVEKAVHQKPRFYQRVFEERPGGKDMHIHVGFVGQSETESESVLFIVYDPSFDPIGFYLENGATFVYDSGQTARQIGNYGTQRALALIYEKEGPFRFAPFK